MTNRRRFLAQGLAASASLLAAPSFASPEAQRRFEPGAADWRTFEVTTRVQLDTKGAAQLWVPVPSVEADWQLPGVTSFSGNGDARLVADGAQGVRMVHAQFASGTTQAMLEVTSRVRTRDRLFDWSAAPGGVSGTPDTQWTAAAATVPVTGKIHELALAATRGAKNDAERAVAIYEWVAANAYRDPSVRGCGEGDVRAMVEDGKFGGKCADINALFVGMCRAVGVPARDLYGIRLAPSAFGYRELGGNSASLSGAQHCRAEAFVKGHGWVAMDPADVTKVMRQESAEWIRSVDHPLVAPVHRKLKGCCEGNWMAYNNAHDVALPGSTQPKLPFFMYPVAETGGARIDSYAPDKFRYAISARELA